MANLKVTINLSKLDKSAFFEGKNGKYASFVLWENRDGEDQYGNTHAVKQDLGKDRKGEKSDYVGNAKPIGGGAGRDRTPQDAQRSTHSSTRDNSGADADADDSEIPF